MAPSKNAKRASDGAIGRAQKKAKEAKVEAPPRSPSEIMLDGVMEALCAGGRLPAPCAAMFKAIAPHSLGTFKDQRTYAQNGVVHMIGDALESLRGEKEQSVSTQSKNVEDAEGRKTELDAAVVAAEHLLTEKAEAVNARDKELAEVESKVTEAKAALTAVQEENRAGSEAHAAHENDLAESESVKSSFEALRNGTCEAESDVASRVETVQAAAARLNLESSLATSLPLALAKNAQEKGPFDELVFQEVAKLFDAELSRLRCVLEEGAPAAAQRAQAVAAVQGEVDCAESVATEKRQAFDDARSEKVAQKRSKDEAAAAVLAFAPSLKQAACDRDEAQAALDHVVKVIANYEVLRDRSSVSASEKLGDVERDTDVSSHLETAELGA